MKTVIDSLIATTGWTGVGCTLEATTWPEFAASGLSGQTRMTFAASGTRTATKTFTADVTGLPAFAFNIVSKDADAFDPTLSTAANVANMRLKVKFISGASNVEYWVPLTKEFVSLRFLNPFSSVTSIVFTATAAVDIFISEIIAYKDQMPLDAQNALRDLLAYYRDAETQVATGTVTGTAGSTTVTTLADYIDKYYSFKVGSEICQVLEIGTGGTTKLKSPLVSTHVNAVTYLYIPVSNNDEEEDVFPGIKVQDGFNFEQDTEVEANSVIQDSFSTTDTVNTSIRSPMNKFIFVVEGGARESSALEIISRIMRKALTSRDYVWINGQRHEIEVEPTIKIDYGDATDIYDKIQTTVRISAGEDIWPQTTQTTTLTNDLMIGQVTPP